MIIRMLAGTAAGLVLFAGAAHAEPVKGAPELTQNPVYKAKTLKTSCKAKKGTGKAATRKYVTTLVDCLNDAWKPAIKGFKPVKVSFKESGDTESCSTGGDFTRSFSEICATTIQVRLADDWIKAKDDSKAFASIVGTWSGVVTGQTGIGQAWWALENGASEPVLNEQNRRYYLQNDCFAGVTVKSLGRTVKDWKSFFKASDLWPHKYHGKPANRLAWAKKGYAAGKPGACNTWTASSSKVS